MDPLDGDAGGRRLVERLPEHSRGDVDPRDKEPPARQLDAVPPRAAAHIEDGRAGCEAEQIEQEVDLGNRVAREGAPVVVGRVAVIEALPLVGRGHRATIPPAARKGVFPNIHPRSWAGAGPME